MYYHKNNIHYTNCILCRSSGLFTRNELLPGDEIRPITELIQIISSRQQCVSNNTKRVIMKFKFVGSMSNWNDVYCLDGVTFNEAVNIYCREVTDRIRTIMFNFAGENLHCALYNYFHCDFNNVRTHGGGEIVSITHKGVSFTVILSTCNNGFTITESY